jgi:transcriptional regulator with PAS, ATPase and Fis domain
MTEKRGATKAGSAAQTPEGAQALRERNELLEAILDASAEGLMFVNPAGIITYVNRSYESIHNVRAEDVIGRHVTEVVENTRMHLVARTGNAELSEFQLESNRSYVVSRIPVFKEQRLIGAVGKIVFRDFETVEELAGKVDRLKQQLEYYRGRPEENPEIGYDAEDIVAVSPRSAEARDAALRVAPKDSTVLLLGESGVGKEVYAHAIHAASLRARGPFVRVNCAAIVESLFESELFGYAEGAFTGAAKGGRPGKFELANMGTIFLDEIADMPLEAQAKLLRVLQEQEIEKLGGGKHVKVDVRVIAASNQELEKMVREGKFRKDLFFRVNVIPITIPPLRERLEDVPALVAIFWAQLSRKHGLPRKTLTPDAMSFLTEYSWPGNVRELRNLLERALAIVRDNIVTAEHLRILLRGGVDTPASGEGVRECRLKAAVEAAERKAISSALASCNQNRAQAARLLGITRQLLYKKMHRYQLL